MIMFGKAIISLIWVFWVIVIDSTAEGQETNVRPHEQIVEEIKSEYNPTYSSTYDLSLIHI